MIELTTVVVGAGTVVAGGGADVVADVVGVVVGVAVGVVGDDDKVYVWVVPQFTEKRERHAMIPR